MRETIGDWKKEWIETNGVTNELEVLIKDHQDDGSPYIYEGCFADIPAVLECRRVIENAQVIDSSIQERIGAYSLLID